MLIDGTVKNITTKTKAEDEGNVKSITKVTVEFEDLDQHLIEQLAFAEHHVGFLRWRLDHARYLLPSGSDPWRLR